MKFREYYAQVEAVSGEKPSELPSGKGIILTFSTENAKKEKRYYTHIRNVLEYTKHVSKTMEHETYKMLAHNYNHYYSEPIKQAKALLERNIGERRRFKMSKQEWLIGRFLRDNKDDLYRVTGLSRDPADSVYVKNVLCRKIQGGSADYEYVVGSKDIKVDPHVAIQLVVDYYDDVKYETLDYSTTMWCKTTVVGNNRLSPTRNITCLILSYLIAITFRKVVRNYRTNLLG